VRNAKTKETRFVSLSELFVEGQRNPSVHCKNHRFLSLLSNPAPNSAPYVLILVSSAPLTVHRQRMPAFDNRHGHQHLRAVSRHPRSITKSRPFTGSRLRMLRLPHRRYSSPLRIKTRRYQRSHRSLATVWHRLYFHRSHQVPPQASNNRSRVYTPDAWIYILEEPNVTLGCSGVKPSRMNLPSFEEDSWH
jgi:hypothetical protein